MDQDSIKEYHEREARTFLGRMYFSVNCSHYHLVPAGEGDDRLVKQSMLDIVKLDPVMTKVTLRFFRTCLASDVASYMKRLVAVKPEVLSNADALERNYFDKVLDGKYYNSRNFSMKF